MASPRHVLVIGGTLPIGRHVVHHLVTGGNLPEGSTIRVVDRRLLPMAQLSPAHERAFAQVEYIQANMGNVKAVERVFARSDDSGAPSSFHWVFNCASDAGEWEVEEVWNQRFVKRPLLCARQAVHTKVEAYIHLSSGNFYPDDPEGLPDESMPLMGNDYSAKYTRIMEETLKEVPGLPLIILRPAFPWGLEDRSFTMAVLVSCDLHTRAGEPWVLLWNKSHRIQGCNYTDIARAFTHLAKWYESANVSKDQTVVYNLAGTAEISKLFMGGTGLRNSSSSICSHPTLCIAPSQINRTVEEMWLRLLNQEGVQDSPLIPYISIEFLTRRTFRVDGSAITRETGFNYEHDGAITAEAIGAIMQDYMDRGLWPSRTLYKPAPKNPLCAPNKTGAN
ncbi:hypothetical protein BJ684DRAFT_10880 [Piptocephalis cylindrospora]|uniref:NAD-dependent epimerase/dehydratase domain-containing protein n=1 Tax=Piptocephalis cylindrospora TaxID=1907219 RepID=A0A4P9Y2E8_9FUNG|nr:hypothetical protein BJ684DRAFT_10880 [Piptocephalis cylindrospora]|eukprot:RKP12864.1 hypothetical protein BJ684DRAFT_10880 [Piptocephalis cylindrospora]